MTTQITLQTAKEPDGFVVWDHQDLVVARPDQHRSRFSWQALRRICLCADCREHHAGQPSVAQWLESPTGDTIAIHPGIKRGREYGKISNS
jgi:hypothetical protein